MKVNVILGVASAAAGAIGTILLFRGSFAYEQMMAWGSDELIRGVTARNKRRQLYQRAGLALILVSFILQGVAAALL